MDIFRICVIFLAEHVWYWALFFFISLAFIGHAIYAYFRLDRPEIKREYDCAEIEMTKRRIGEYLIRDLMAASTFFLVTVLSLALKLALMLGWI